MAALRAVGRAALAGFLAGLWLLPACARSASVEKAPREHLGGEVLLGSSHCQGVADEAEVRWIDDPAEYGAIRGRSFAVDGPPAVDFARDSVVLVNMGRRPTAGYALAFVPGSLGVSDGTLRVTVRWTEPDPGAIVAQVLTHPCLLLRVPRVPFARIEVRDQDGKVRLEGSSLR